jgi:hypothetical protein
MGHDSGLSDPARSYSFDYRRLPHTSNDTAKRFHGMYLTGTWAYSKVVERAACNISLHLCSRPLLPHRTSNGSYNHIRIGLVARICRSQSSKDDQFRQGRGSIPRFGILLLLCCWLASVWNVFAPRSMYSSQQAKSCVELYTRPWA